MKTIIIILVLVTTILVFQQTKAKEIIKDKLNVEHKDDSLYNKTKRFSNITEAGYMFGFGNAIITTGGIFIGSGSTKFVRYKNNNNFFSFITINGYEFNHNTFLGLGLGAEIGENKINLPIFADGRIYFFNKKTWPLFPKRLTSFVDFAAGYSFNWIKTSVQQISSSNIGNVYNKYSNPGANNKGGAISNAQIGIRVYISKNFFWIFGLGYRFQHIRFNTKFTNEQAQIIGSTMANELTHFFTLKTGFVF